MKKILLLLLLLLLGVLCSGIYLTSCQRKTNQGDQTPQKELLMQINYLDEVSQMQINTQTFITLNTPWMDSLTSSLKDKSDLKSSLEQIPIQNVGLQAYSNLQTPPMSMTKQQKEDFKTTIDQYLKDFIELKNNSDKISIYLNNKQFLNDNWALGNLLLEFQEQTKQNLKKQNRNLYDLIHKESLVLEQALDKIDQREQTQFLSRVQYLQINNLLNWLNSNPTGKVELQALETQVQLLQKTTLKNKSMHAKIIDPHKLEAFTRYQNALDQQLNTIDQAIKELLLQGHCNTTTKQELINGQKSVLASFNSYLH